MRDIVVSAMLIAAGVIGLTNADTIKQLYAMAYPQAPAKALALDRCAASSEGFDRLAAAARAGCYARMRVPPPIVQPLGPPSQPKEDIRRLQAVRY